MEPVRLSLTVRMLKAEVSETLLLYGCVTWTLSAKHFARLRTVHHQVLLRVIGFQRRQPYRLDYTTLSYPNAIKRTRCESIETTVHKWRRLFAAAVARQNEGRLPRRVMFGTMTGGVGPRPGGHSKTWRKGLY